MNKLILLSTLLLSGCATGMTPNYVLKPRDASSLTGKAGTVSDVKLDRSAVHFQFTNTTDKTSKIIWDETVLISTDGSAKKIAPGNTKAIDADRSHPPAVVPARSSIQATIIPSDHLMTSGAAWAIGDILPCVVNPMGVCNPKEQYGKPFSILLTIENDGKKHEYRIDTTLEPNPAAERKPAESQNQPPSSIFKPSGN